MIGIKSMWKRLKTLCMKIKSSIHQFLDSLDKKTYPNHSHISTHANPNAKKLPAAQKLKNQSWIFCQKIGNWKLGFSTIQSKRPIAKASSCITEANWIIFQPLHAQNWYREFKLYHSFCIIVLCYLGHIHAFLFLIYANWMILKLTMWLNWVFMHCMKNCHGRLLGFFKF